MYGILKHFKNLNVVSTGVGTGVLDIDGRTIYLTVKAFYKFSSPDHYFGITAEQSNLNCI